MCCVCVCVCVCVSELSAVINYCHIMKVNNNNNDEDNNNSIQDYLYSAFYNTIVAKQLYRKLSFYNRFIYCRNVLYLTYGKIWLILYS